MMYTEIVEMYAPYSCKNHTQLMVDLSIEKKTKNVTGSKQKNYKWNDLTLSWQSILSQEFFD